MFIKIYQNKYFSEHGIVM